MKLLLLMLFASAFVLPMVDKCSVNTPHNLDGGTVYGHQ